MHDGYLFSVAPLRYTVPQHTLLANKTIHRRQPSSMRGNKLLEFIHHNTQETLFFFFVVFLFFFFFVVVVFLFCFLFSSSSSSFCLSPFFSSSSTYYLILVLVSSSISSPISYLLLSCASITLVFIMHLPDTGLFLLMHISRVF